jgi:Fic family protein
MITSLNKIQTLQKQLLALPPITDDNKRKLDKKFRLEFNYNSNHIEGNTLTYSETELLLIFDKTEGGHEMRELEEMKAHDVAYNLIQEWASDKEHALSEQRIKELNKIILVKSFYKDAITPDGQATRRLIKIGDYKEHPNSVRLQNGEMFHYASPAETPIQMGELMQWYHTELEKKELHPIQLAALLHYKFVCIHPFDDGNGRISRLLMNYVLLCNNLQPVIIKTDDKKNYLFALNQADAGNIEAFVDYIGKQLIWSLETSIKANKGESIDELGDFEKRLTLINRKIDNIDSEKEIKKQFSEEVFLELLNNSLRNLIIDVIPKIQTFNQYYLKPNHSISISNGVYLGFVNENPEVVFDDLLEKFKQSQNFNEHDFKLNIYALFGPFIKGGLDTFGCNYGIEVKFNYLDYQIFIDEFGTNNVKVKKELPKRLLHSQLNENEIGYISDSFSKTLLDHLEYYIDNKQITS